MNSTSGEKIYYQSHLMNKILFEFKGIQSPTASLIRKEIDNFEWMNGEKINLDKRNKEYEEEEGELKYSYFIYNLFHNFGF